jgi:putative transcriptional regulator
MGRIEVDLDVVLAQRHMSLTELSERVGVTVPNLSILKTGKAKAVRFSTLAAICRELNCQPGELLRYVPDGMDNTDDSGSNS